MDKAIAAIYPQTFENWIALCGVLVPLVALAGTGFWRAYTYSREQRQSEWKRFQELLNLLHNTDKKIGLWSQIAAVHELASFRRIDKQALVGLVGLTIAYWRANPAPNSAILLAEMESLQKRLG